MYDTFQYVSVEATLRSVTSDEYYVQLLLYSNSNGDDSTMKEFKDGKKYSYSNRDTSRLFCDGMEMSNPLRRLDSHS